MAAAFEMYRRSAIGMSLTETLDEMVFSGALTPELAIRVLLQFDEVRTLTDKTLYKHGDESHCLDQLALLVVHERRAGEEGDEQGLLQGTHFYS
jgi:transcription initiation factor TFIIA small subunit